MKYRINLISGVINIRSEKGKKFTSYPFENIVVKGNTDEEIRKNFKAERCFRDKLEKKKVRELQISGRVVLTDYSIIKDLGWSLFP